MNTDVLRRATGWNRPLMSFVAVMAILTVVTGVGILTDPRVLLGAPIWLKPFKFAVSFVLYGTTMAWMLSLLPKRSRLASWGAVVLVATASIEMILITMQAWRGVTSHFNATTPFDAMVFNVMGTSIMVFFVAHLVVAVVVLRRRIADRTAAYAVRLGLGLSALGMLAAVPMVQGNAPAVDGITGAHSVGVLDGGPGMPLTGWSTVAGDLRVGHFVGLHALQALPLLAMLLIALSRRVRGLDEPARVGLLLVGGAAYGVLTMTLTWQALRGQSLVHPDALTLGVWAVLVVATAVGAAGVFAAGRRRADITRLELAA
jgi:hypothetical protein